MLVAQDFRQKVGFDSFDTYLPVAHVITIWVLLILAFIHKFIIYQIGVKTAFLYGDLEEKRDLYIAA